MEIDYTYVQALETTINKLLPVYDKYYNLTGEVKPELLIPKLKTKRIPILLIPGALTFTPDRVKPRKN